jgi:hypothetical protein
MDEEIQKHLAGKRYTEAFELVLAQYQNKVFRLAYSMLGNRELAEDAAQEIFVRIWRALPGQAPVGDWFIGDDFHHNGALYLAHAFRWFSMTIAPVATAPASRLLQDSNIQLPTATACFSLWEHCPISTKPC